jgi:hypothetical protein
VQVPLAFSITLAAIFFKSDSTNGKTSAAPENKEEKQLYSLKAREKILNIVLEKGKTKINK